MELGALTDSDHAIGFQSRARSSERHAYLDGFVFGRDATGSELHRAFLSSIPNAAMNSSLLSLAASMV
jgi:hypothetical protein